jgi:phasin family protein
MLHCNISGLKGLLRSSSQFTQGIYMNFNADQFTATNAANLETLKGLTTQAYAGFEKLVELNMAATKALVGESFSHTQAVLGAKDAQELLGLQSAVVKPMAEKTAAYGRHVYTIATEANAEFTKVVEAKTAEAQKAFADMVETATKNAPAGSESAVAMFKNALTASQNAMESAKASAKKAAEAVETNFTAVANKAVAAATAVTKV